MLQRVARQPSSLLAAFFKQLQGCLFQRLRRSAGHGSSHLIPARGEQAWIRFWRVSHGSPRSKKYGSGQLWGDDPRGRFSGASVALVWRSGVAPIESHLLIEP